MFTRHKSVPVFALVIATALFCTASVFAGGDRDHSGGFFLRLSGGGSAASTSTTESGTETKFDGPAGDVNFAIGAIVSPNLAIHGTLWGWLVSDPDVTFAGFTGSTSDVDLSMGALGVGLTYYFMPANIYLSGSFGVASLTLDVPGFSYETDAGFAADFTAGKEWWVGNNWGIGVAVTGGFHNIPDPSLPENLTGGRFGVRFTATMN